MHCAPNQKKFLESSERKWSLVVPHPLGGESSAVRFSCHMQIWHHFAAGWSSLFSLSSLRLMDLIRAGICCYVSKIYCASNYQCSLTFSVAFLRSSARLISEMGEDCYLCSTSFPSHLKWDLLQPCLNLFCIDFPLALFLMRKHRHKFN